MTGATGFIGRWVARRLAATGARLFATARDTGLARELFERFGVQAELIEADLAEAGAVEEVLVAAAPDVVFNLAGYGVDRAERDDRLMYELNAVLVERFCRGLLERPTSSGWSGQRLVHAGSALEYGRASGDLEESGTVPLPGTAYGRAKLAGTRALAEHRCCRRLLAVCARLFTVYGPGEHEGRLLPSLLDAARRGEPVDLTEGRQERDFIYVEEVAETLVALGRSERVGGPVVNVATGRLRSVRDFVRAAAGVLGIPGDHLRFGALPTRPDEMNHQPVSVERLRAAPARVPSLTPEEGVARTRRRLRELGA